MSSPALRALEAGNRAHVALWSEVGTFREVDTTRARINRIAPVPSGVGGEIQIQLPKASVILLPKTLTQPLHDEVFTESDGTQHRLTRNAVNLGYAWQCDCDIIDPE